MDEKMKLACGATQSQIKRLYAIMYSKGWTKPQIFKFLEKVKKQYKAWDLTDIDTYQMQEIYKLLGETK